MRPTNCLALEGDGPIHTTECGERIHSSHHSCKKSPSHGPGGGRRLPQKATQATPAVQVSLTEDMKIGDQQMVPHGDEGTDETARASPKKDGGRTQRHGPRAHIRATSRRRGGVKTLGT